MRSEAGERRVKAEKGKVIGRTAVAVASLILLAGCAGGAGPCSPGVKSMLVAEMLFGRNVGDRVGVSEAAFRRFVDEDLTPRFPNGLTVLDAQGQYGSSGGIVKEPSKVVVIALDDTADAEKRLNDAAEAYKRRFRQESVGIVRKRSCVSF
jgi:hypothetical protein